MLNKQEMLNFWSDFFRWSSSDVWRVDFCAAQALWVFSRATLSHGQLSQAWAHVDRLCEQGENRDREAIAGECQRR